MHRNAMSDAMVGKPIVRFFAPTLIKVMFVCLAAPWHRSGCVSGRASAVK
jgi:hypothetical protein